MKLRARELSERLARGAGGIAGLLIHGADPVAVALLREEAVTRLAGPGAEAEMRLTRVEPARLRADPALLQDAARAAGFFPGPRVVLVEEAGEGLAGVIGDALAAAEPGTDAVLVVTAGILPARSKLRALFEGAAAALAVQLFDEPPGPAEVAALLAREGVPRPSEPALELLVAAAAGMDAGSFRQIAIRLAVDRAGDPAPLPPEAVEAVLPQAVEASVDEAVAAAAGGRLPALARALARLGAQGIGATTLAIAAGRHFRTLHAAAADPRGAAAALDRARPPVKGPRRTALLADLAGWTLPKLEAALRELQAADLDLRSGSAAPDFARVERALVRVAFLRARG